MELSASSRSPSSGSSMLACALSWSRVSFARAVIVTMVFLLSVPAGGSPAASLMPRRRYATSEHKCLSDMLDLPGHMFRSPVKRAAM